MVYISQAFNQNLDKQQKILMMKKLLFAVCRNYWEKDRQILSSVTIKQLIQEVRECYPNLKDFKYRLNTVINQLNKREKYLPIATQLILKFETIYQEAIKNDTTIFDPLEAENYSEDQALKQEREQIALIVRSFQRNQHSKRLHKMLFALSKQRWENNPDTLSKYPIDALIQDIRKSYPYLEQVGFNLLRIVKGLNKQEVYLEVAKTIIAELNQLYQDFDKIKQIQSLVNLCQTTAVSSKTTDGSGSMPKTPQTETEKSKFENNDNFYRVREQIMKQTNPLKVKMLLFYSLNTSEINCQKTIDELFLTNYELDAMVMELAAKIATIQQLQDHLEKTAFNMASLNPQMFNIYEFFKIAKIMVVSMKPLYEIT